MIQGQRKDLGHIGERYDSLKNTKLCKTNPVNIYCSFVFVCFPLHNKDWYKNWYNKLVMIKSSLLKKKNLNLQEETSQMEKKLNVCFKNQIIGSNNNE